MLRMCSARRGRWGHGDSGPCRNCAWLLPLMGRRHLMRSRRAAALRSFAELAWVLDLWSGSREPRQGAQMESLVQQRVLAIFCLKGPGVGILGLSSMGLRHRCAEEAD